MLHSLEVELMTLDGVNRKMANRLKDWHNQHVRLSRRKISKIAYRLGYDQSVKDYSAHLLMGLN